MIQFDNTFDYFNNDNSSRVFEDIVNVFKDDRGGFCQKLSTHNIENVEFPSFYMNLNWIKQVNHSYSKPNVLRGFHAQKGKWCQAKLVENCSNHGLIYDIIIDARPDSMSFGVSKVFTLRPITSDKHNLLWVPKGFLHGFVTSKYDENLNEISENLHFQYFVDESYNKESETGVAWKTIFSSTIDNLNNICLKSSQLMMEFKPLLKTVENKLITIPKDDNALDYEKFMNNIKNDFNNLGKLWYK